MARSRSSGPPSPSPRPRSRPTAVRWIVVAALAALAGFAAMPFAGERGDREADVVARVRAKALEFAKANGETVPRAVRVVATKERKAVAALSGAQVASNRDVYAVTMTGTFVGRGASRIQRGTAPPRGRVLVAAFDARTLELVFWGVTNREPRNG